MTRKRYIKLLMSIGYTRNVARGYAELIAYDNRLTGKWNKRLKERGVRARCISDTHAGVYKAFADYPPRKLRNDRGRSETGVS